MPARTNPFQQVVKYLYDQIADGAKVTESAFLTEPDGTPREVDILIEWKFAGSNMVMAIECRDHSREQNVTWIDALIGKYANLRVNKIVAVSSSKFYRSAKAKAARHGIEAITRNEALTKDWRAAIEGWRFYTHSFTLMRIATIKADNSVFTLTNISEDGQTIKHQDEMSGAIYPFLYDQFVTKHRANIEQQLWQKISENWQHYFQDETPRWAELTVDDPGISANRTRLDIRKVVYGIATFFHKGSAGNHFALREHALSDVKVKTMQGDRVLRTVFDDAGKLASIDFGDGKTIRGPFHQGMANYHFPPDGNR